MTERKLKIAISVLCFRPSTGGLQAFAEQLSQHLQKQGHDVVVVARAATRVPHGNDFLFFNETNSTLTVKGVPVRPLKFSRIWIPVLWLLGKFRVRRPLQRLAVRLYRVCSRNSARKTFAGVDIIHHLGEAPPLNGFAAAAAAKYWKIPFVISPTCHPCHVGDSSLDFLLYREANRLLVYTQYEANYFRQKSLRCPIDIVGAGIEDRADGDAERFRAKFAITGPFILFIGRKDRQKGYPLLLDAFKLIRRERQDISLVCMGPTASPDKQQQQQPIDGLIDLDFTSEELKHDALAACTCVCVPSDGESFGLVFMEAGRYGKPAVGRKVPVLQELLRDGAAALLLGVPDEARNRAILNAEDLATALLRLLSDPNECRRIGENCRAVSDQFVWSRVIRRFEQNYYEALNGFQTIQPDGSPSQS